jgi:hypothetical protein
VIRYTLACERGHDFESWFKDSAAYDRQVARSLVACPNCGSTKVEKAIMAPQVARKDREAPKMPAAPVADAPNVPAPGPPAPVAMLPPEAVELRRKIRELHETLTKNAEDVGAKFPEVARQIHYGEIDDKPIYGEATLADARDLIEEGIGLMPLPVIPDEQN